MSTISPEDQECRSVEDVCKRIDASLESLKSTLGTAAKLLKSAIKQAQSGNITDLRKATTALDELGAAHALALSQLRSFVSLPFVKYLESTSYADEIVSAATGLGLDRVSSADRRIRSTPVIARIVPQEMLIVIGKKRHKSLRPSAVALLLKQARTQPNKARNESVLEAIAQAYLLASNGKLGSARPISELYAILTMLPNIKREYTIDDFTEAIVAIDDDGPSMTKNGLHVRFHGDTIGKGGTGYRMTRASGLPQIYGSISFSKDAPA